MSPPSSSPSIAAAITRTIAGVVAVIAVGAWLVCVVLRFRYPYDLEWMEGGMLCHALRIAEHAPIYAPPTVEFVPYLYTPLYSLVVAWLGKIFGIGYFLGRAVSLVSFAVALGFGYVFARREGGSRFGASFAVVIPIAAYAPTGAWVDIARPDSFFVALVTAALCTAWWGRRSHAAAALSAVLFVAAFFTKQTATPFMFGLCAALLVVNRRVLVTHVATLAVLGLPLLYFANNATRGWFWIYVFEMHQRHAFYPLVSFVGSPLRLFALLGPGLLVVAWALLHRRAPGLVYATYMGVLGAVASSISFGTQGAFTNAFIPAVSLLSIAIATTAGRMLSERDSPAIVSSMLALTVVLAPGFLLVQAARVVPISLGLNANDGNDFVAPKPPQDGYRLLDYVPTAADRAAGDAIVERLRGARGEVFVPFHPFYAHLAGKTTFLHRMGVSDVGAAKMAPPAGLFEAFAQHRFSMLMFDLGSETSSWYRSEVLPNYHVVDRLTGPRTYTGNDTRSGLVLAPNP